MRGAIAHQLECFAVIARIEAQFVSSAKLFGAAEALREAANMPRALYERANYERETAALCEQMPPDALEAAWAVGRALTMEQAVDLALQET